MLKLDHCQVHSKDMFKAYLVARHRAQLWVLQLVHGVLLSVRRLVV